MTDDETIRIEPWGKDDLPLLAALLGDPQMTRHLGGPEKPDKLAERHARYARGADAAEGPQFRIVDLRTGVAVGWVGYWERTWKNEQVYEIGWSVLPRFQGRGIAGALEKASTARGNFAYDEQRESRPRERFSFERL